LGKEITGLHPKKMIFLAKEKVVPERFKANTREEIEEKRHLTRIVDEIEDMSPILDKTPNLSIAMGILDSYVTEANISYSHISRDSVIVLGTISSKVTNYLCLSENADSTLGVVVPTPEELDRFMRSDHYKKVYRRNVLHVFNMLTNKASLYWSEKTDASADFTITVLTGSSKLSKPYYITVKEHPKFNVYIYELVRDRPFVCDEFEGLVSVGEKSHRVIGMRNPQGVFQWVKDNKRSKNMKLE
jgi:hypothetical protein